MKDNKLKKFETVKDESPKGDTEEEFAAFIAELVEIGEKIKPTPNQKHETTAQTIEAMNNPVVTVQTHDGKRLEVKNGSVREIRFGAEIKVPGKSTETSSFGTTETDSGATTFTDSELKILEKLKHGE